MGAYPFWVVHALALVGVLMDGWSTRGAVLAIALYYFRMFFITGAYHRYFSHRTYKTSRWFQFLLAFFGATAGQKGPIWWAEKHRHHHKFSDKPDDLHSVRQDGFLWAHLGWILTNQHNTTDLTKIKDLTKYPELMLIHRFWYMPVGIFFATLYFIGGWHDLLWGGFVSTTLLWHGTFTINSLSHVWGAKPFPNSGDDSKNNFLLALLTLGEGWHNNHHHYQGSCRQGFRWYQVDISYYVILLFAKLGLVWNVKEPPAHMRDPKKDPKNLRRTGTSKGSSAPKAQAA